jgi:hypothetical protein
LIGRPVDRETKPLRKYESVSYCRAPGRAGGSAVSSFTVARSATTVEKAGHFRAPDVVYPALTAIRKDCIHIGKEASARLTPPRPKPFAPQQTTDRVTSRNGEQAWL